MRIPRLLQKHLFAAGLAGGSLAPVVAPAASARGGEAMARGDVVVCLGDSITDGNTWPQIVMRTLGENTPTLVCAGAGGDGLEAMDRRFDTDVAFFKPAVVALLSGVNDANIGVTPEAFEEKMRELLGKIDGLGARAVLMTPIVTVSSENDPEKRSRYEAAIERLERYAERIEALGHERGLPVAPVRARMARALEAGETLLADDGIHPNYRGQAIIARAFLEAVGVEAATPAPMRYSVYPGLVRTWTVSTGVGDANRWEDYTVPEPAGDATEDPEEWTAQMRANGFALDFARRFGPGPHRLRATVPSPEGGEAWLHLGGGVKSLSLNGAPLPMREGWAGYHAGYQRIPVPLRAGDNTLAGEVEGMFLVLVTTDPIWERGLSFSANDGAETIHETNRHPGQAHSGMTEINDGSCIGTGDWPKRKR